MSSANWLINAALVNHGLETAITRLQKFKYKHHKHTHCKIGGKERDIDDFNPRIQLKNLYEKDLIYLDVDNTHYINLFSKRYIVDRNLVESGSDMMRSAATKQKTAEEKKKNYEDYDWGSYVQEGTP